MNNHDYEKRENILVIGSNVVASNDTLQVATTWKAIMRYVMYAFGVLALEAGNAATPLHSGLSAECIRTFTYQRWNKYISYANAGGNFKK